jgi:hypothetical protein
MIRLSEEDMESAENFVNYYDLKDNTPFRNTIIGLYFGFTTLSTVGFGDYTPRSNFERVVGSFILILGVAIFSALTGNYISILKGYQNLNSDLDEGENLAKFMGTLKRFNEDIPVMADFKSKIEEFFDYKWDNDRTLAIVDPEDEALLEQLPEHIINRIYTDFLFTDFLQTF